MAAQQCGWAPVFIAPGRGRTSQARIRHAKRPALFGVGGGIDAVLRLGDARYTGARFQNEGAPCGVPTSAANWLTSAFNRRARRRLRMSACCILLWRKLGLRKC